MGKTTAVSQKAVIGQLTSFGMFAAGLVGGNIVGNMAEKALNKDGAAASLPKRLMVPLGLAAIGAIGAIKVKDPKMKLIASGLGAAGIVRGLKTALPNVAMLQGADDGDIGDLGSTASYGNSNWIPSQQQRSIGSTSNFLDLPDLSGSGSTMLRDSPYASPAQTGNSTSSINGVTEADVIL